jgi:hypothetical protein
MSSSVCVYYTSSIAVFWDVEPCIPVGGYDLAEEHTASFFKVKYAGPGIVFPI